MLPQFERQRSQPKLAARADVSQGASIEPSVEVVAMRAEPRGAALDIAVAAVQQRRTKAILIHLHGRASVGEVEPRSAVHGGKASADGRAQASQVFGPGPGDGDCGCGNPLIPERQFRRAARTALQTA